MFPSIAHGSYEDVSPIFSFTTVVQYKCDEGYVLVGEEKITCRNSHWSSLVPQCKGNSTLLMALAKMVGLPCKF